MLEFVFLDIPHITVRNTRPLFFCWSESQIQKHHSTIYGLYIHSFFVTHAQPQSVFIHVSPVHGPNQRIYQSCLWLFSNSLTLKAQRERRSSLFFHMPWHCPSLQSENRRFFQNLAIYLTKEEEGRLSKGRIM